MTPSGQAPRPDFARYSTIGLEFALIVGALGWLGHLADEELFGPGGFPVFLLLGLATGLVGGILRMSRQLAGLRRPPDRGRDGEDRP